MGLLDQIGRTIAQGVDRAKFEAEKFQRTTRLQAEINDLRRQVDDRLHELGQRAYELLRAGQIQSASLTQIAAAVDQLRSAIVAKEEELKRVQAEVYVEPPAPPPSPPVQSVPIDYGTPPSGQATKWCSICGFQMPSTALFCPNCGTRVG